MPLTELVCYCQGCAGRSHHPVEVVLDHATRRGHNKYTYELLASMLAQQQNRGSRISTTTLTTKCLRSEVLQRTTDWVGDPDLMYAAFRGTLWHGQLELHAHPQAIAEARFHVVDLFGMGPFSGSPDLVDPKAGTLYDYKFNKENPKFDYPWANHVEQVQVNRWLVDHADWVEHEGEVYCLTEVGLDYTANGSHDDVRANRAQFVPIDWQGLYLVYMDDKGAKPLLVTRSEQVQKKGSPGTRAARVADVWEDGRVEDWIKEHYVEAQDALEGGVLPDPGPGFETFSHPLCGFCPVKGDCIQRHIETQVAIRLAA